MCAEKQGPRPDAYVPPRGSDTAAFALHVSTASVAEDTALALRVPTAFAAKTLPFLAVLRCDDGSGREWGREKDDAVQGQRRFPHSEVRD